jgi:preprotein translocase subunit SecF
MSRLGTLGARLYRGDISYDFIIRRKFWYALSALLLVISVGSLLIRGLSLGIEFRGGAEFRVTSPTVTQQAVRSTVGNIVHTEILVQSVGKNAVRAQTESLTSDQLQTVQSALASKFGVSRNSVSTQFIGPSWGKDISTKALRALLFFLLGVVIFLSLYFEWKMAMAAMIALLHDLVITAGLYSLVGFEVTPATVIGFLTILGYSLYDTVVVFDKVRENTRGLAGGSRMTYGQAANLAVNQTLVRSINTSIIALLPIAAILFAGVVLLGAGPLKDLSLALFIGVAVGAYSSIFIATPLLVGFKEREPAMQALAKRVAGRRAGNTADTPSARRRAAAAGVDDPDVEADAPAETVAAGAARRPAAAPKRPPGASQRSQPRKGSGGRNRTGGKKRR